MTIRAVLLDIEGTTTPISFVFDVLFPYARHHVADYLERNSDNPDVLSELSGLRKQRELDVKAGLEPPDPDKQGIVGYIHWLMDRNSKAGPLKSLQGKIWRQGYEDGTLKASVFPDVPPVMAKWHGSGVNVSIFSSGSVLAQQLLFKHTDAGDLTQFITNYFDTAVGSKTHSSSYSHISQTLGLRGEEVHFISDVPAELDAAAGAGLKTSLCIRPGNAVQEPSAHHNTIRSFDEL